MKLHIVSDLHLEFGDLSLPGGETLIVAGDMFEARSLRRNDSGLGRKIATVCRRFINEEFSKYENVLYVPGNHEYYGRSIEEAENILLYDLPETVIFLQDDVTFLGKHRFYGSTIWASANNDDPNTHVALYNGMADFRVIKDFSTKAMVEYHKEKLNELELFLNNKREYPTVVITHHAPSFKSVHPKFENEKLINGGFASNLDYIMEKHLNIPLWVHGHMHNSVDYTINKTRVVANPRGYFPFECDDSYKPLEIDI